jgi:hypothetical protein
MEAGATGATARIMLMRPLDFWPTTRIRKAPVMMAGRITGDDFPRRHIDHRDLVAILDVDEGFAFAIGGRELQFAANRDVSDGGRGFGSISVISPPRPSITRARPLRGSECRRAPPTSRGLTSIKTLALPQSTT